MTRSTIHHALGLHMHQPPGNLRLLIDANPWEAEQIIRCYERPARYALQYRDVAQLHVGFSGVLLEQLLDPEVVDRYRHLVDIPAMLARYAEADNIELIGMGYYHPIFPLIPRADWSDQLAMGQEQLRRAFGRAPRGFWPPEMAFSMEMIPALVEAGYDYVVVDGVHVRPEDGISDVFRPYLACHEGVCITVVPRDRDVSNAQESGLDPNWFQNEVRWRVGGSPRPDAARLVTTWSDGENGGWFRQTHEGSGFFGYYFAPYMEHVRGGEYPITPVSLSRYLQHTPGEAHALVQTGAWNVAGNAGQDLSQWSGSESQRAAVAEVARLSARYWSLRGRADAAAPNPAVDDELARARRLILEAETSCFLFWGDAWIPYLYDRTRPAGELLAGVEAALAPPASLSQTVVEAVVEAVEPPDPVLSDGAAGDQAEGTAATEVGTDPLGDVVQVQEAPPVPRSVRGARTPGHPGVAKPAHSTLGRGRTAKTSAVTTKKSGSAPKAAKKSSARQGPGGATGSPRRGGKRGPQH